jgi:5-methylcytosine-specific restriction endonuclease McrA
VEKRITLPPEELKELKEQTKKRDHHRCRYPKCSNAWSFPKVHSHHIQFRSDQGSDTSGNLCTLCYRCHDAAHGKIKDFFLVIVNPESDLIPPDANKGLRFKTYLQVGKRVRWRVS